MISALLLCLCVCVCIAGMSPQRGNGSYARPNRIHSFHSTLFHLCARVSRVSLLCSAIINVFGQISSGLWRNNQCILARTTTHRRHMPPPIPSDWLVVPKSPRRRRPTVRRTYTKTVGHRHVAWPHASPLPPFRARPVGATNSS